MSNGSSNSSNGNSTNNTSSTNGHHTTDNRIRNNALSPPPKMQDASLLMTANATIAHAATSNSTAASANTTGHVSQKTVEALGDWLLESASVQSGPAAQEQRRRQVYKSSALINKTMKQSQEERRKQALAEQAKKRYQFTNHARKLALFASGQPSEGSSDSEAGDSRDEEDDEVEDEDEDDDGDGDGDGDGEQDRNNTANSGKNKKKKRSNKHVPIDAAGRDTEDGPLAHSQTKSTAAHKRRLSIDSGSESAGGRKMDKAGDVLSPKKPRLQKKHAPSVPKKKKDRNPFRDQMMIPEAMTDIPTDLDTSYYTVPLPIGHRCFVISADGKTTARLPSGQLLVAAFESCLPAGSSQYRGNRRSDYCILDCVYSSVTRTFWTLDIMCWRGHPVYECETEFRFWWLRGKLAEIESLQSKWIASQTREWDQEVAKKRQKRARQIKRRQEKAAAAATTATMDVVLTETPEIAVQEEGDDGDDEAGTEGMDVEDTARTSGGNPTPPKKFWPIVFTPLPYFNASIDLVRLMAESMYQPTPSPSLIASLPAPLPTSSSTTASPAFVSPSKLAPATSFSSKSNTTNTAINNSGNKNNNDSNSISGSFPTRTISTIGTMALSGEIATAASLFPAHDTTQKMRQDQTLVYERAAGLVFFNKKTMYVLGTTPLCGWVTMEQIGDVFFGEEGGIGPMPGTSAVEGREVEMEDALERIRI
ncbi:hypothetical protein EDD21DRAFT_366024 [Dissophora ornata]|nr:hypothetical protein EDD21DRAFT_366024 [Dissophora ornata]